MQARLHSYVYTTASLWPTAAQFNHSHFGRIDVLLRGQLLSGGVMDKCDLLVFKRWLVPVNHRQHSLNSRLLQIRRP